MEQKEEPRQAALTALSFSSVYEYLTLFFYFLLLHFLFNDFALIEIYLATNPILFISDSIFICWDVFLHYTAYINTCNFILFQPLVETSRYASLRYNFPIKHHIPINLNFRFHTYPTCGIFAVQVPINAPGGRKANERTTSTVINSLARINTTTMRINKEPSTNSSILGWLSSLNTFSPTR